MALLTNDMTKITVAPLGLAIRTSDGIPLCADEIFNNLNTLKAFAARKAEDNDGTEAMAYEGQRVSLVTAVGNVKHYTVCNHNIQPLINAASCGLIEANETDNSIKITNGLLKLGSRNSDVATDLDSRALKTTKIIAGNGLTPNTNANDLSTDRTLSVKASNGITVNSNGVSVKIKTNGGITVNSDGIEHYTPATVATNKTTGGRTYINSITFDDFGHVTAVDTGTETDESHKIISGLKSDGTTNIESASSSTDIILGDSGVTANSYGEASSKTLSSNGNFKIPYITVNSKGIVTSVSNKTMTMPELGGSDFKGIIFSQDFTFTESFGKYSTTYEGDSNEKDKTNTNNFFNKNSIGSETVSYTLKTEGFDLETLLQRAFSKSIPLSFYATIGLSHSPTSTSDLKTYVEYGTSSKTLYAYYTFSSGTSGLSLKSVGFKWSDGSTISNNSISNITAEKTGSVTATATLSDNSKVSDSVNYTIIPQKYTYYAITTSTDDPTSWNSFGSTSTTGIKFNNVRAGSYLWIASTTNNYSMYQLNELSGKYNDDAVPTTKSTSTKSLKNAKNVSTPGYYFYRTTNKTSVDSSPTFKLDS